MKLFTEFAYLQSINTKTPAERMEAVLQLRTHQREKTRGRVISVRKVEDEGEVWHIRKNEWGKCDNDECRMTGEIYGVKCLKAVLWDFHKKMFKELQIVHHIRGRGLGVRAAFTLCQTPPWGGFQSGWLGFGFLGTPPPLGCLHTGAEGIFLPARGRITKDAISLYHKLLYIIISLYLKLVIHFFLICI